MKKKNLPLYKAVFIIFVSIFFVSGSTHLILKAIVSTKTKKAEKSDFYISNIIQTGPNRDRLKTSLLAEIMDLSLDSPTSIFRFDPKLAEERLKLCPMIKKAKVKPIHPNTVFVDYEMRKPLAFLYDFENIAIDEEGYLFPFYPFYTPKKLPQIYLGLDDDELSKSQITSKSFSLAHDIISSMESLRSEKNLFLKRLDVSKAFHKSLGKREIIALVRTEDKWLQTQRNFSHYLRLSTHDFLKEMGNYLVLYDELSENNINTFEDPSSQTRMIDLRIKGLALIKEPN